MNIYDIWDRASDYITYFETERIRELIINLDQQGFMILVGATALLVILCLIKKMLRTATLIVALCATTVLLHFTIPEQGEPIALSQIIGLFAGGTFIVAMTVYLIFIRTD